MVGNIISLFLDPSRIKCNDYVARSLWIKIIDDTLEVAAAVIVGLESRIRIGGRNTAELDKETCNFLLHFVE